jgi:tetratricopeptide (TPR) repeat protein
MKRTLLAATFAPVLTLLGPVASGDAPEHMQHVPTTVAEWARGAQLYDGLGDSHRRIATSNPQAQKYFDQGMRFAYAFNHDEATRSFAKAAELDPHCASCYWGVSLTVGPNYNLPLMVNERAGVAVEALRKAQENGGRATPVEQALIGALAKRYPSAKPLDPSTIRPVLVAYAAAMKAVARKYPQDLDVQTLYAESLMNINAWKLWDAQGAPGPDTVEIVATLESVLARDPHHVGANHYYVHAIEASPHPEKALESAERLKSAMPSAGHLVHMPSHILQRVGRYEESAEANRKAVVADDAYSARAVPPDYYPMYTAHNYQFLAYSAAMEGRKAETLAATNRSRELISDEMLLSMPGGDWYIAEMYAARVRFGLWKELLAMPAPNPKLPGLTAGYLYARGIALASTGRLDEARKALGDLQKLAATIPADAPAGQNTLKDVLEVAIPMVKAHIAAAQHSPGEAVSWLRQAAAAEDHIAYDEPKNWFFPARHVLGAQLLQMGKSDEAEAVYRQDLQQNPHNGWALFGLSAALKSQGKTAAAADAAQQFATAWKHADVALVASAF